jgi:uncharacterized repeat protein (TIGR01451 family)
VPTIAGTFSPNNPLSAFDGQDLSGVWRMTVSDHFNPDSGTLTRWCLRPILNLPELAMTKSVAAAHSPARPGDALTYTLVLSNTGAGSAVDVGVVDTLPAYINGSGLNTTVTVTVGQVIRFTLPASLSLEVPAGLIISNTATYSHPTGGGQASAALVVSATLPPKLVYLPLIRR